MSARGGEGKGEVVRAGGVRRAAQASGPQKERRKRKKRKGVGPRLETWPSWATQEGWADEIEKEKKRKSEEGSWAKREDDTGWAKRKGRQGEIGRGFGWF
jgi:hypothetical protein